MTNPDVFSQTQEVFRDVFGDDTIEIAREMTADDVDGWDSMMHINLVIAVEQSFGIKIAMAEISGLKEPGQDVGTFLDLIETKTRKAA